MLKANDVQIKQYKPDVVKQPVIGRKGDIPPYDAAKIMAVWKSNSSAKNLTATEIDKLSKNVTVHSDAEADIALSIYCSMKGALKESGMTPKDIENYLSNIQIAVKKAASPLSNDPQRYDIDISAKGSTFNLKDVNEKNAGAKISEKLGEKLGVKPPQEAEGENAEKSEQSSSPQGMDPALFASGTDERWKLLDMISKARMDIFDSVSNEKTPEEEKLDEDAAKKAEKEKQEQEIAEGNAAEKSIEEGIGQIISESKRNNTERVDEALSQVRAAVNLKENIAPAAEDVSKANNMEIDAEEEKGKRMAAVEGSNAGSQA